MYTIWTRKIIVPGHDTSHTHRYRPILNRLDPIVIRSNCLQISLAVAVAVIDMHCTVGSGSVLGHVTGHNNFPLWLYLAIMPLTLALLQWSVVDNIVVWVCSTL